MLVPYLLTMMFIVFALLALILARHALDNNVGRIWVYLFSGFSIVFSGAAFYSVFFVL